MQEQPEVLDNPYIGRIVVIAAPFIASLAAVIANAAQDLIGADLDGTQLTVFLTGVFVSIVGLIIKWLDNRGHYERIVEAGQAIHEAGTKYAPSVKDQEPTPLQKPSA